MIAAPSLGSWPVFNIFSAMTHSSLAIRTWCIGIIAAFTLTSAVPAWAEEGGPEYTDPTIVPDTDTTDDVPQGVKNLGAQQVTKKKWEYDTPPVYQKWWFWVTAVAVTAAVTTLAVWPLHMPARGCKQSGDGSIPLNCFGDGRAK